MPCILVTNILFTSEPIGFDNESSYLNERAGLTRRMLSS